MTNLNQQLVRSGPNRLNWSEWFLCGARWFKLVVQLALKYHMGSFLRNFRGVIFWDSLYICVCIYEYIHKSIVEISIDNWFVIIACDWEKTHSDHVWKVQVFEDGQLTDITMFSLNVEAIKWFEKKTWSNRYCNVKKTGPFCVSRC